MQSSWLATCCGNKELYGYSVIASNKTWFGKVNVLVEVCIGSWMLSKSFCLCKMVHYR